MIILKVRTDNIAERTSYSKVFNIPIDQNINPQHSLPVRVDVSDASRSILTEQNMIRDVEHPHGNENVLQEYDITSNQQEINNDMKFLSHSDLIDLNLNELNDLLTGNGQNDESTAREYFLEEYNFNNDCYEPEFEVLLTKQQKEAQTKSSDCNAIPMMSSSIEHEKNYLLIPVNEDIENSTMLQNCKSIELNAEVLNKIDTASAGRSGVLIPLQMDTSNGSVSPTIKRKTPIRVVRSLTTNRIITSKNKPETMTSTGIATNITVHQTINIYETAEDCTVQNSPLLHTRKRKQTFEVVKHPDDSEFHNNIESPAIKRPVKEEELTSDPLLLTPDPLIPTLDPLIPTTSCLSPPQPPLPHSENIDMNPSTQAVTKKNPWNKGKKAKATETCPKCNLVFKKLSLHAARCKFDKSLVVTKKELRKKK